MRGLSGLWRIWFDVGATQQYYPLVHSTFWLGALLWGDATIGYHFLSLALHATSAVLVAVILRALAIPGALLAAAVFALHPVHVESVAWMAELKNTLSGALFLAASWRYIVYDETRARREYLLAGVLFLLALLSKTVTATWPAVMLVVIWWRRGALDLRRDVRPLLPFVAAGAAAGLFTAWVERTLIGAQGAEFALSLADRVLVAARAIWFYFGTLVWPFGLSFNYPRWSPHPADWTAWLPVAAILGAGFAAWRFRRVTRAPLASLMLFVGMLLPALGFLNVYPFRYSFVADHFQYLASLAVIAPACAGVTMMASRVSSPRVLAAWAAVFLAALGLSTSARSRTFADAEVLWRDTLDHNRGSRLALTNLGVLVVDQPGQADEAAALFREALRQFPSGGPVGDELLAREYGEMHCNLALALARAERIDEAVEARRACNAMPAENGREIRLETHRQIGAVHLRRGHIEAAVEEFEAALRLEPASDELRLALVVMLQRHAQRRTSLAQIQEAIATLEVAPSIAPKGRASAALYNDLGVVFAIAGQRDDAGRAFTAALAHDPAFQPARQNLARLAGAR
jgi:Tfp pilus assembly protein PilF